MPEENEQTLPVEGMTTLRMEAFSDGVFAIVITLLVLDLKVPNLPTDPPEWALVRELWKLWPSFISYVVSFVVIGIYWVTHASLFHYIRRSDHMLLWLNILFLLSVAFIPFPTAMMGRYWNHPSATMIYGGSLAVSGGCLNLLWWHATRQVHLVEETLTARVARAATHKNLTAPLAYAVAAGLSSVSITTAILLYILIPIYYLIPGRLEESLKPSEIERVEEIEAAEDAAEHGDPPD